MPEDEVTTEQAAEILKVTPRTVRRWVDDKKLTAKTKDTSAARSRAPRYTFDKAYIERVAREGFPAST